MKFICRCLVIILLSFSAQCGAGGSDAKLKPHEASSDADSESLSQDASLAAFSVAEGSLSPNFESEISEYELVLPYRHNSLEVELSTTAPASKIKIASGNFAGNEVTETLALSVGDNEFSFTIQAEQGNEKVYQLTVRRAPQYVFVTSLIAGGAASEELHMFKKSNTGCGLTHLQTYAVEADPYDISYDPKGFLYVANSMSASISMFKLNYEDDSLEAIGTGVVAQPGRGGSPVSTPFGMAIHADGFLYAGDGNALGAVAQFSQDTASGQLTSLTPGYIDSGNYMWFAAIHPSNNYLYVTNFNGFGDAGTDSIYQYDINQTNGLLSAMSTASVSSQDKPWHVTVHASGKFVYANNYGSGTVSSYDVNQTDGSLTVNQAGVASGTNGIGLTLSEEYLYNVSNGEGRVYQYAINQTSGDLTALTPAYVATTGSLNPYGTLIDYTNQCVYVGLSDDTAGNNPDAVEIFSVGSDGTLSSEGTEPAGLGPRFIAVGY